MTRYKVERTHSVDPVIRKWEKIAIREEEFFTCSTFREGAVWDIPGVGRFCIPNSGEVLVQTEPGVSDHVLEQYLENAILALRLHQQGTLVLHGAVVGHPMETGALAILGSSGMGKSTLAHFFTTQAWSLIEDDNLILERRSGTYFVEPGRNHFRLWKDALEHFNSDPKAFKKVLPEFDKHIVPVHPPPENPLPLKALIVLQIDPQGHRLDQLKGLESVQRIMEQLKSLRFVRPDQEPGILERIGELVNQVPVFDLHRPRDLNALAHSYQMICNAIDRA